MRMVIPTQPIQMLSTLSPHQRHFVSDTLLPAAATALTLAHVRVTIGANRTLVSAKLRRKLGPVTIDKREAYSNVRTQKRGAQMLRDRISTVHCMCPMMTAASVPVKPHIGSS
jgi:hypothetical protein